MSFELCIGSAQFGLNYGITNSLGKIADNDIKEILLKAHKNHIHFIDTAQNYGSSEEVIGTYKPLGSNFKIVSKLSSLDSNYKISKSKLFQTWDNSFYATLRNLKVDYLYSFLVHNAEEFSKSYKDFLIEWLKSLKSRSLVQKIGVSIYSDAELVNIPLEEIDIIQLPFSIYDQRLLKNGTLKKLSDFNISIHMRSIFLQGLILTPSEKWPLFINKSFLSSFMIKYNHSEVFCCNIINSDNWIVNFPIIIFNINFFRLDCSY